MRRYMWRMRVAFMGPELTSALTETHDSDGAVTRGCLFWVSNRTCKAHTPAGRGRAAVLCQPRPSIITARTPACHLLMPYCRCAVVTPRGSCSAARVRCPARSAHSVNVGPQRQRTSRGTAEEHMHAAIRSRRPHARAGYACDCVTRRKHHRPGIAPNANTTHVPTAGSSAAPTKPNHTPSRLSWLACVTEPCSSP